MPTEPTGRLELIFPLEAKGKQRPRATSVNGRARMYTPKQTQDEEYTVASLAFSQVGQPLLETALRVEMQIDIRPPKSFSKKRLQAAYSGEERPTSGRLADIDNVAKLYLDALNGLVWVDDRQICELLVTRRYAELPRVTMTVEPLHTT